MSRPVETIEQLLARAEPAGDCLQWTGVATTHPTHPYGIVVRGGRKVRAHRLVWELANGQIPAGMLVCHSCDNTLCVRLEHLFLGTNRDNTQDMLTKQRHGTERVHGERHHKAVLTEPLVREIRAARAAGESYGSLADRFGVSKGLTWQICAGRIWKHVQQEGAAAHGITQ